MDKEAVSKHLSSYLVFALHRSPSHLLLGHPRVGQWLEVEVRAMLNQQCSISTPPSPLKQQSKGETFLYKFFVTERFTSLSVNRCMQNVFHHLTSWTQENIIGWVIDVKPWVNRL